MLERAGLRVARAIQVGSVEGRQGGVRALVPHAGAAVLRQAPCRVSEVRRISTLLSEPVPPLDLDFAAQPRFLSSDWVKNPTNVSDVLRTLNQLFESLSKEDMRALFVGDRPDVVLMLRALTDVLLLARKAVACNDKANKVEIVILDQVKRLKPLARFLITQIPESNAEIRKLMLTSAVQAMGVLVAHPEVVLSVDHPRDVAFLADIKLAAKHIAAIPDLGSEERFHLSRIAWGAYLLDNSTFVQMMRKDDPIVRLGFIANLDAIQVLGKRFGDQSLFPYDALSGVLSQPFLDTVSGLPVLTMARTAWVAASRMVRAMHQQERIPVSVSWALPLEHIIQASYRRSLSSGLGVSLDGLLRQRDVFANRFLRYAAIRVAAYTNASTAEGVQVLTTIIQKSHEREAPLTPLFRSQWPLLWPPNEHLSKSVVWPLGLWSWSSFCDPSVKYGAGILKEIAVSSKNPVASAEARHGLKLLRGQVKESRMQAYLDECLEFPELSKRFSDVIVGTHVIDESASDAVQALLRTCWAEDQLAIQDAWKAMREGRYTHAREQFLKVMARHEAVADPEIQDRSLAVEIAALGLCRGNLVLIKREEVLGGRAPHSFCKVALARFSIFPESVPAHIQDLFNSALEAHLEGSFLKANPIWRTLLSELNKMSGLDEASEMDSLYQLQQLRLKLAAYLAINAGSEKTSLTESLIQLSSQVLEKELKDQSIGKYWARKLKIVFGIIREGNVVKAADLIVEYRERAASSVSPKPENKRDSSGYLIPTLSKHEEEAVRDALIKLGELCRDFEAVLKQEGIGQLHQKELFDEIKAWLGTKGSIASRFKWREELYPIVSNLALLTSMEDDRVASRFQESLADVLDPHWGSDLTKIIPTRDLGKLLSALTFPDDRDTLPTGDAEIKAALVKKIKSLAISDPATAPFQVPVLVNMARWLTAYGPPDVSLQVSEAAFDSGLHLSDRAQLTLMMHYVTASIFNGQFTELCHRAAVEKALEGQEEENLRLGIGVSVGDRIPKMALRKNLQRALATLRDEMKTHFNIRMPQGASLVSSIPHSALAEQHTAKTLAPVYKIFKALNMSPTVNQARNLALGLLMEVIAEDSLLDLEQAEFYVDALGRQYIHQSSVRIMEQMIRRIALRDFERTQSRFGFIEPLYLRPHLEAWERFSRSQHRFHEGFRWETMVGIFPYNNQLVLDYLLRQNRLRPFMLGLPTVGTENLALQSLSIPIALSAAGHLSHLLETKKRSKGVYPRRSFLNPKPRLRRLPAENRPRTRMLIQRLYRQVLGILDRRDQVFIPEDDAQSFRLQALFGMDASKAVAFIQNLMKFPSGRLLVKTAEFFCVKGSYKVAFDFCEEALKEYTSLLSPHQVQILKERKAKALYEMASDYEDPLKTQKQREAYALLWRYLDKPEEGTIPSRLGCEMLLDLAIEPYENVIVLDIWLRHYPDDIHARFSWLESEVVNYMTRFRLDGIDARSPEIYRINFRERMINQIHGHIQILEQKLAGMLDLYEDFESLKKELSEVEVYLDQDTDTEVARKDNKCDKIRYGINRLRECYLSVYQKEME